MKDGKRARKGDEATLSAEVFKNRLDSPEKHGCC